MEEKSTVQVKQLDKQENGLDQDLAYSPLLEIIHMTKDLIKQNGCADVKNTRKMKATLSLGNVQYMVT